MIRTNINPRDNWQQKIESLGFSFHTFEKPYWDESVYYSFTLAEIETIESATNKVWDLCLEAVQYIIDQKLYNRFHIPEWIVPHIENSWNSDAPSIYGRMDFTFKDGIPKLLEFNADTPTSLLESSVVQWFWLKDVFPDQDQFNSIHEKLIKYWKYLIPYMHNYPMHFTTISEFPEDLITTEYMRDCAIQAGISTKFIDTRQIGWDEEEMIFYDEEQSYIKNVFKLYPYEWLINEEFGSKIIKDKNKTCWIEPSWKMLLSNKAILPILWKLFPECQNLLPSFFESDNHTLSNTFVKKPLLSREGANITIMEHGNIIAKSQGEYGSEGYILQEFCALPNMENNYPLIGSWLIGQQAAGIGIRESLSLITDDTTRFVPHIIE